MNSIAIPKRGLVVPRWEFPAWVRSLKDLWMASYPSAAVRGKNFLAPSAFSPSQVSGYLYDWNPASLALSDGGAVASWIDGQSSVDFAQGTGSQQPTRQTVTFNGKTFPVVRFDGADDFLASASQAALAAMTIYLVVKSGDTDTAYALDMGGDGVHSLITQFTATKWEYYDTPRTVIGTASTTDFQAIVNPNGTTATGVWTLGAGAGGSSALAGDVARLLVYNNVVSAGNNTLLLAYLTGLYGTA